MNIHSTYHKTLIKAWLSPVIIALISTLLLLPPLLYWQYEQTRQAVTAYEKKLNTLKKQQRQLKQLYSAYQNILNAQKDLTLLSAMGLFKTPTRAQWIDMLLLHASAWLLPDMQATLYPARPLKGSELIKKTRLDVTLRGYTELEPLQLYDAIRQHMTPFVDWRHCTWQNSTSSTNERTPQPPTETSETPLQQIILQTLAQQKDLPFIQINCNFNIYHAPAPQGASTVSTPSLQQDSTP